MRDVQEMMKDAKAVNKEIDEIMELIAMHRPNFKPVNTRELDDVQP